MSSSALAISIRPPTRGRLYTPILDVVPPLAKRPRPVLLAGLGQGAVSLREALGHLPGEVLIHEDFGTAREAIDTAKPLCLLVDVTTDVGRELLLDPTPWDEATKTWKIAIVADPAGRETLEAFALGVDDVVGADAFTHVSLKIRDLLAGGGAPMIDAAPGVLIADPNRHRRAGIGGQMRHLGLRVRFARDHKEVRYEPGTRLVIASAWLPSVGATACLRSFRRQPEAASIPWVFVGTPVEIAHLQQALGNEPGIEYFRTDADPHDLVTSATSLLRPRTNTRRRSIRLPFHAPVRFDVDGAWSCMWGCSSDLSMGGMFVRTLTSPPVGATVQLRFQLPSHQPLALDAVVVRRVEPRDAGAQAPGFGVQFAYPLPAHDQSMLDAGYRRLLAERAHAKLAEAGV